MLIYFFLSAAAIYLDVIIGMDWLEQHGPMQVHWQEKWLAIPFQGQLQLLQGIQSVPPAQLYLQVCALLPSTEDDQQELQVPSEI